MDGNLAYFEFQNRLHTGEIHIQNMEDLPFYVKLIGSLIAGIAIAITHERVKQARKKYQFFTVEPGVWNRFLQHPKIWCDEGWILFEEYGEGLRAEKTDFIIHILKVNNSGPNLKFNIRIDVAKDSGMVIPGQATNMYQNIHDYFS